MANHDILPPGAALAESLRAYGYSLATAVADIIDNSIAAGASNVWLDFYWDGSHSSISIRDDGEGMSDDALFEAMAPGNRSPLEDRHPDDLGRFGMGLKTASFSQCRRLSVISKTAGGSKSMRCWDLDVIAEHNEWRLLREASENAVEASSNLDELKSGTLVMWENMDRVTGNTQTTNSTAHENFLKRVEEVRDHLAMTFHRYLATPNPKLKIWING